jgi:hypothetical protein
MRDAVQSKAFSETRNSDKKKSERSMHIFQTVSPVNPASATTVVCVLAVAFMLRFLLALSKERKAKRTWLAAIWNRQLLASGDQHARLA